MKSKDKILDELLIMKFKEGDAKSLSLFVKRWHTKLIWFSFQTIHDTDDAQDIVQESWSGIISGLQNLNEIRTYKSWMFKVIRNKSIDRIRKMQREQIAMENFKQEGIDIEQFSDNVQNSEIVIKVLQTLSSELKEVLQLFYLERQTVEEISGLLGVPKGTVKSRLFRAREQMKTALKDIKHLLHF